MRKYISTEVELEVEDGLQWFNVDGYVHYSEDINYGADADGNRGIKVTSIDDIEGIQAHDKTGNEFKLEGKNLTEAIQYIEEKFFQGE